MIKQPQGSGLGSMSKIVGFTDFSTRFARSPTTMFWIHSSANVIKYQALHIPSLSLAAEFHTILHRGRRANMAIARFTQEKGAKSSFERVIEALERVLKERGLLVEDRRIVNKMRKGTGM